MTVFSVGDRVHAENASALVGTVTAVDDEAGVSVSWQAFDSVEDPDDIVLEWRARTEMTNAVRADRARRALDLVAEDANDDLTNIYDLICDLLHLADRVDTDDHPLPGPNTGRSARIANVLLLLAVDSDAAAADFCSETLNGMPYVLDWAHAHPLEEATVPYQVADAYSEGDFLAAVRGAEWPARPETAGRYAARMGLSHYEAELAEEALDAEEGQPT